MMLVPMPIMCAMRCSASEVKDGFRLVPKATAAAVRAAGQRQVEAPPPGRARTLPARNSKSRAANSRHPPPSPPAAIRGG